MNKLDTTQIILLVDAVLFLLGVITFITGIIILASKAMSRDIRTISSQTAQLAQKGIAEDVAGLVGNASALMNALQQMVKTATGIGVFMVMLGILLIGASIFVFLNINNFPTF
ncbi:MAG: hypothetical protein ABFS17_00220 [Chloroflexota bacterium]